MMPEISTLPSFLDAIDAYRDTQLVFVADGIKIRPGYHVTEIKAAAMSAVDCGRQPDTWPETIIQLLDGASQLSNTHMTTTKFAQIAAAALAELPDAAHGQLFFEFGPGNTPVQKFSVSAIEFDRASATHVTLKPIMARCKPKDRWLASPVPGAGSCCGSNRSEPHCCP